MRKKKKIRNTWLCNTFIEARGASYESCAAHVYETDQ